MGRFTRTPKATVEAEGRGKLRVRDGDGKTSIVDVEAASWIGFVNIGESFSANEDGWWLIGDRDGAAAINVGCPPADILMRDAPLRVVADNISERVRLDFAELPAPLRGQSAASGFKRLDAAEAASLRRSKYVTQVASVLEFPILP